MKTYDIALFGAILPTILFHGCASQPSTSSNSGKGPGVLTIYPDGSMEFEDRTLNEGDVIIYSDGSGGERAAIKLRVPLRQDKYRDSVYYRDSIIVKRFTHEDVANSKKIE